MNSQKVLTGMAIGAAVAGIGFIAFHPGGKKLRGILTDFGSAALNKITETMRTEGPKMAEKAIKQTA